MGSADVIRSIRVDADLDAQIRATAQSDGKTVSTYVRDVIAEDLRRRDREERRRKALDLASRLPATAFDRDEAWGVGDRVPR